MERPSPLVSRNPALKPNLATARWRGLSAALLALWLGLALAQTFGRPRFGPFSILILGLFIALLWRTAANSAIARAKRGAWLGLLFGIGWFGGGLWWLYISMAVYGGMPAVLAGAAVLLFSAYLAIYPALACALAAALALPATREPWHAARGIGAALALAAAWTLAEVLRGTVFTGFPWAALGYAQVGNPLAGYAPLLGMYGVGFAAALAAALLALLTQVSLRGAALAVALLVLLTAAGQQLTHQRWTRPIGQPIRVALLQGNVPQSEKFQPERLGPTLNMYGEWLTSLRADLIVTPETGVPVLPEDLPPHYLSAITAALEAHHAQALLGIPLTRGANHYTNSILGLGGPAPYRYDKAHLVPFGEFIPEGFHWFVRLMHMPLGDFARGTLDQPPFVVHGDKVAPTICYEDLFGEQFAQRFRNLAQAPNIIANLTNLAWFGDTIVIAQHLEIARMRSLEFQLPTIRATNTGATAIIGADGRVLAMLKPFTVGVLTGRVQGYAGTTPFAAMASRWSYAPIVLLCLLALGLGTLLGRKRMP